MAEDRNFLEKFIFPTKEEQKAFKKKQDKAKVITEWDPEKITLSPDLSFIPLLYRVAKL